MSLNPKQGRFAREYVIDLNGTQAAIRAGYSEKTAGQQAFDLLKKPEMQARIAELAKDRMQKAEVESVEILREISKMAYSNMLDYVTIGPSGDAYVDLSQLTRDQAAAIQEIVVDDYLDGRGENAREVKKVKIKLADKTRNLELLGKYRSLWTDRVEHTGSLNINGVDFTPEDDE